MQALAERCAAGAPAVPDLRTRDRMKPDTDSVPLSALSDFTLLNAAPGTGLQPPDPANGCAAQQAAEFAARVAELKRLRDDLGTHTATLDARSAELDARAKSLDTMEATLDARAVEVGGERASLEALRQQLDERRAELEKTAGMLERRDRDLGLRALALSGQRDALSRDAQRFEEERRALEAQSAEVVGAADGVHVQAECLNHQRARLLGRVHKLRVWMKAMDARAVQLTQRENAFKRRLRELTDRSKTPAAQDGQQSAPVETARAAAERAVNAIDPLLETREAEVVEGAVSPKPSAISRQPAAAVSGRSSYDCRQKRSVMPAT